MTETESWQVSVDTAEIYESIWVPAMLGQWPPQLVDAAHLAASDRVLDVACGTGIVAREAASRVATAAQVTGLDINEGMLAVAERIQPEIDWRLGDALALPFADESYDVVTCQFALMYFPDRLAALQEMRRVLRPGGSLVVAVWASFERATGYVILTEIAERWCGQQAVEMLGVAPFVLGDKRKLTELLHGAGIIQAAIELREGSVTFPTIEQFVEAEVKGTPLGELINEASYQKLLAEAREKLQRFCVDGDSVVMPMDAYIITATKPGE